MSTCKFLPFCAFILLQGACGMPATVSFGAGAPSYGTQFQADFNKNLAAVMSNLHNGVSSLAAPPIRFGLDTVPGLVSQGVHTATDRVNRITDAGREGLQRLGVGAGQALGGGGVLGSSIAGGVMQVAGHGLGVGVDVADAGAKAGLDLLGRAGDNAASGIAVGTTIGGNTLSTLGNGMIAAGTGVSVLSNGLATLLDVVGSGLSSGVNRTEQAIAGLLDAGVLQLQNGALSFSSSAQANVYNILNSFLQILVNVQKLFDTLRANLNVGMSAQGVSGAADVGTGGVSGGATEGQAAAASSRLVRELQEPESEELPVEEVEADAQTEDIETDAETEDVETAAQPEDIETAAQPDDIEIAAQPDDIETAAQPDDIKTAAQPEDIETAAQPEDIETAAQSGEVESVAQKNDDSTPA